MDKPSQVPYGPDQKNWNEIVPSWSEVSSPLDNPIDFYDSVPPNDVKGQFPKIEYKKFELPPEGLTEEQYSDAMSDFKSFITTQHKNFTGYQTNEFIEHNQELSWMLDIHANNVGDPFTTGIFALNTKFIERSVLDYFAALWRAPWPYREVENGEEANRYWGYVLSMGSTEGNIYGLYNGRMYLSGGKLMMDPQGDAKQNEKLKRGKYVIESLPKMSKPTDHLTSPNKYKPIAFFSEDTHYSVIKGVNMCSITNFSDEGNNYYPNQCPITEDGVWPDEVPSHNINHDDPISGTINVEALEKLVDFFLDKGHPIFIVLNQGSTWKGAYDDIPAVNEMLKKLGEKYPWLWERNVEYLEGDVAHTDVRRGFWVHVDGALGAAYLPFLRMAQNQGKLKGKKVPIFDFSLDCVMSIVCSSHKWIGAPWPGGVYMTLKKFQVTPPDTAGYIGSPDTTLGGSRNAFTPVLFWKYFARNGYEKNIQRALDTESAAAEFESKLKELENELKQTDPDVDLWIHRSELSLAILFRMVNPEITYKYTVDSETILVPYDKDGVMKAEYRTYAHIYSMSSLSEYGLIDKLIGSIRDACKGGWKNAFPDTINGKPNPQERIIE